jgi:hypothetical protein
VVVEPFFVPSELGLLPSAKAVGPWASGSARRPPIGWLANGLAVAVCTLHDHRGPIGASTVCAVPDPRMAPIPSS